MGQELQRHDKAGIGHVTGFQVQHCIIRYKTGLSVSFP
jgi:hypothetical protein